MATTTFIPSMLRGAGTRGVPSIPAGSSFTNIYSVLYDGVDDRTETSVNYSEFDGETKGSFSFWFKSDGSYGGGHLAKVGPPYSRRTFEHLLSISSTTRFTFYMAQGSSGKNFFVNLPGNPRTDGLWHHIMVCLDLSKSTGTEKAKFFYDGNPYTISGGSNLGASFPSHPATLTVGGTTQGNGSFTGNIDEVAFWAGVDLRDDITTIYNSGIPNDLNNNGLTLPTTYYRMGDNNGGTGTTITDNGTTSYDLSFVSAPIFEEDVPS